MPTSPAAPRPTSLLGRVAGWCFDHRTKAIGLWLVAFVAIFGAAGAVGSQFSGNAQLPGSGSAAGFAVLALPEPGTWALPLNCEPTAPAAPKMATKATSQSPMALIR